jgi:putative oxidoreductase
MKKLINYYFAFTKSVTNLSYFPLLLVRLILAYGFYEPAMMKFKDINAIAEWFDSLGLVFPTFQAYLATYTELLGVFL